MRILMANFPWIGGIAHYIEQAFSGLGHSVVQAFYEEKPPFYYRALKLHQVKYLDRRFKEKQRELFNQKILILAEQTKPDIFFVFNEGYVNMETVEQLKNKYRIKTVCLIGDDPFDSFRFHDLPYSLKYFDHIYVAEKLWIDKIRMVAPNSKLFKIASAYDHNKFNIQHALELGKKHFANLNCQISFCGESYNQRAEGGYRSAVFSHLTKYDFKFWGDKGWKYQFKFYPELEKAYAGGRLSFDELIYLYARSLINMNMPSPQLITAFQPRVLEIAACGGFQLVDYREDLFEVFKDDEIATFKTIPEMLDKIDYFIKNPEKRNSYITAGLERIKGNTWKDRMVQIIKNLREEI
jgi:spore maturation protein CgeB